MDKLLQDSGHEACNADLQPQLLEQFNQITDPLPCYQNKLPAAAMALEAAPARAYCVMLSTQQPTY